MKLVARLGIAPLAALLVSAAPTKQVVPLPHGEGEALVIPSDSPVHFRRFGKYDVAQFSGRFVLSGTFVYSCEIECEPPLKKDEVFVRIIPDRTIEAALPHWKIRNSDMRLYLVNGERLSNEIVTRQEKAALLAGKIDNVRRHVSIVVDDFRAGIECDSSTYSARYIALERPAEVATAKLDGDYGCG